MAMPRVTISRAPIMAVWAIGKINPKSWQEWTAATFCRRGLYVGAHHHRGRLHAPV